MKRFRLLDASTPRLTREGVYYVGVMLFVISGAVAKQLNLLVLLCGMLVAPLVLHLRLVSTVLRGLAVRRRVPQRAYAGEAVHVQVGVLNPRRRIPSWMIVVRDQIRLEDDEGRAAATSVDVRFPLIRPGEETWSSYRLCLSRRGRYVIEPARVSTRFPLGLFHGSRRMRDRDTLTVVPRLGAVTPAWSRLIWGEQAGGQQTVSRQGLTEAEFFGLREWRAGDSRRWIHWRTSARLNSLAVRQFERQRQADVGLLLDLWLPEQPTEQQLVDLERAISFAATAIQLLAVEQNAWLALLVVGKSTREWSGPVTASLVEEILQELAVVRGGPADHAAARTQLQMLVPLRGRRIVISSRPDPLEQDDPAAAHALGGGTSYGEMAWIDVSSAESEQFFGFAGPPPPVRSATSSSPATQPATVPPEAEHVSS